MIHGRIYALILVTATFSTANAAKSAHMAVAAVGESVPGQYLVKFKDKSPRADSQMQTLAKVAESWFLVQRSVVESRAFALGQLRALKIVEFAEPNWIYRAATVDPRRDSAPSLRSQLALSLASSGTMASVPNDPEWNRQWSLENSGQATDGDSGPTSARSGVDIAARAAWPIGIGSREMIVAVIDSGVNGDDADLREGIFTNEVERDGVSGIDDDGNGCIDDIHGCDFVDEDGDPMDHLGHGTHVSGILAARADNGLGVAGVAPGVRLLPIRFLNDRGVGDLAKAVRCFDYAVKMGAKVINNSWGGGGYSEAFLQAIQRARRAGVLVVAAAGNFSTNLDLSPEYPASYKAPNVIAVAALDPSGQLARFSNFGGSSVHIAAPGVNIAGPSLDGGVVRLSGTSMAAPHVSGVAALLYSQDLSQSAETVRARILNSARPLAFLRGRVVSGLVDASHAVRNTVSPRDPDDPTYWSRVVAAGATPSPYVAETEMSWSFHVPGARRVAVYFPKFFTEPGYDIVRFFDGAGRELSSLSGPLGETFSAPVEGDTVRVVFTTDRSVNKEGFEIGGVAYE